MNTERFSFETDDLLVKETDDFRMVCVRLPDGTFFVIVGATGSGSPGSGPFTTIRRYEELKGPGGPGVLGEEQNAQN